MKRCATLLSVLVILGCGEDAPAPKVASTLVPVEGTVTLKGEPVEGAMVIFNPSSTGGFVAQGYTDSKGHYTAETSSGGEVKPGAAPGSYTVIVSRFLKPDGTPLAPGEPPAMAAAVESIPLPHSNPSETRLRATVGQSGGTFDFNLK